MDGSEDMEFAEEDFRGLEDEEHRDEEGRGGEHRDAGTRGPAVAGSEPLYRVKVELYNETYLVTHGEPLETGTWIVAQTRYGKDLCRVLGRVEHQRSLRQEDVVHVDRIATPADLERRAADIERERKAFGICQEKIHSHGLPMKLIFAHYLFEESKVLFFFTAESRVDFRDLVKDLVSVFKTRIELRQIGVRDEARVTGGCGVCGRVLCCHGVTDKLVPVSIKMAKDQNLSLNSLKISGPCGRLLCCLEYEYGFYREARKTMPSEGTKLTFDGTLFRVVEVNVPAGRVRMSGEDGRYVELVADRFTHAEGRWAVLPEKEP